MGMRLIYGNGSELKNAKAMQRRAKCKLITQTTMLQLIDVAKEKGATDRVKSYWNTYHCQSLIFTSAGKAYAPQCKNRFCSYCCGIRKAEFIHKYLPILQTWKDPYFVTLTVKTVKAPQLPKRIKALNRAFRIIKNRYKKRSERGTDKKLMGLKTVECNFNPKYKWYNPHLHLIVPDRETAEIFIENWLALWTKKFTNREAQDCRKVKDTEKDLIEIIKYETKIFTEPDGSKKRGKNGTAKIYVRALDNIYAAMKGIRIIDSFGFSLPKAKRKKAPAQITDDCIKWQYHLKSKDWLTEDHEATLSAFAPELDLMNILENNIDTSLE